MIKWEEELYILIKSKARNDNTCWGRHVKSQRRPKAGHLVPVSQVIDTKGRFFKESKSTAPVNVQMIGKWNSCIAHLEKAFDLSTRSNQPQHSLKPKPNPKQGPIIPFISLKVERGEEAAEEKYEVNSHKELLILLRKPRFCAWVLL